MGNFAWVEPNEKPEAGYKRAKVTFTPTGAFATNYTTAEGTGLVTVKADSVNVSVEERVHTYDGQPPRPNKVTVTGKTTGPPTGQTAKLTYYKDAELKEKIDNQIIVTKDKSGGSRVKIVTA